MEPIPPPNEGVNTLGRALICGAMAGLTVDMTLYPLDTVKTRLMSQNGFIKSGGFKRLYSGLPSVAVGSAPGAALFFLSYEGVKMLFESQNYTASPVVHMLAASVGETMACLFRVPTEVLKTRAQAYPNRTLKYIAFITWEKEGVKGFYRGFNSTVIREIPFSAIQFPLWEYFKYRLSYTLHRHLSPFEGAACGSLAGMISAALTTPLDVAKTRIMLTEKLHAGVNLGVRNVLVDIWKVEGLSGLFAGVVPRTLWMGIGGFIFFGAYEVSKRIYGKMQGAAPWADEKTNPGPKDQAKGEDKYFDITVLSKIYPGFLGDWIGKTMGNPVHRTFEDSIRATEVVRERERKRKLQEMEKKNSLEQKNV